MIIEVNFTGDEKIRKLQQLGFKVTRKKVTMSWPVYHNDTEEKEVEVWTVYDNGKPYLKPVARNYGSFDWVDAVFHAHITTKLKTWLLSN